MNLQSHKYKADGYSRVTTEVSGDELESLCALNTGTLHSSSVASGKSQAIDVESTVCGINEA